MRKFIAIPLLFALTGCSRADNRWNAHAGVPDLDIARFMGTWYSVARFPHAFERDLVGVTATYTLRPDGRVDVLNRGFEGTLQGKPREARAVARIPDPAQPGRLRVAFFWPFGADYIVLDIDRAGYQYALVGSASPSYLWILSRTPRLDPGTLGRLKAQAQALGYNLGKLEMVEQPQ